VVMAKVMLFVVLAKVDGDWLWHNDRTNCRTKVVLGYCLNEFVEGKVKVMTASMVGEMVVTALYG
jgi:hypothetical protein